jgi:hypothetical protein
MLSRLVERKNRWIRSENIAFAILPLVLLPLLPQIYLQHAYSGWFLAHNSDENRSTERV